MTCQLLTRCFTTKTGWTWNKCDNSVEEQAKFCSNHRFARKPFDETHSMPVMPVMTFIMPRNRELKQLMQFVFDKITIPPYDMIEASDILEHIASECNKLLTTVSPKMGGVTLEQFKQIIDELIIGLTSHELAVIILENNFSMFIAAELQQQRLETLNLTNNPAVAHLKLTNKELSNLSPSEKRKRSELLYALKQIEVDGLPSVIERVIEHKTYT